MPSWDEYNCVCKTTTNVCEVTIEDIVYKVSERFNHETGETQTVVLRQGVHGEFYGIEEDEASYVQGVMHAADFRQDYEEPPF